VPGSRPAAGGGRWVDVDPERLSRWLDGFTERHGSVSVSVGVGERGLRLVGGDGAVAELHLPPGAPPSSTLDEFVVQALVDRRLGLLLARRAAVAVGIASGSVLLESKVDSSYVQGRTAAGGWSQQRYARRRANQTRAAAESAADVVARLLLPEVNRLDALVTGGDRRAVDAVLADRRLAPLTPLRADRFLEVGEPRLAVLDGAVAAARTVRIKVVDPG